MISIIACISESNRAIGYRNQLLYHIKSDMARFRELTTGHTVIMGRKTFESLPHGALPYRRNIVVTKTQGKITGCEVYPSLDDALAAAEHSTTEVFVIGGERVYSQALPFATTLYLTIVDGQKPADAFFPPINHKEWKVIEKEMRNENGLSFTFLTLQRQ